MIQLTLTDQQAEWVSTACEFYARIRLGQFQEILWHTFTNQTWTDELFHRKEEAQRLLMDARKQIYPELHGLGHSYGIGKFEDADIAFDVYEAIRYALRGSPVPCFQRKGLSCKHIAGDEEDKTSVG